MTFRALLVAVSVSGFMLAQQPNPDTSTSKPAQTSGPKSPEWRGLSVKEKLEYDGRHLFDWDNLVYAGIGAGFDQLRDRPSEWGQGWGRVRGTLCLAPRSVPRSSAASCFQCRRLITKTLAISDRRGPVIQGRVGDAFLHTIWRHNDSGGMMPAYSEFLGDYGALQCRACGGPITITRARRY